MSTPLHFRREDEGGAAHVMSNGTQNVGPNGFGRSRRQIPGAEFLESGSRTVPGAGPADGSGANGDENLSKAALKNKKKRNNKKAKDGGNGDVHLAATFGVVPALPDLECRVEREVRMDEGEENVLGVVHLRGLGRVRPAAELEGGRAG